MDKKMQHHTSLKPMNITESIIWFGTWAAILIGFVYGGYPIVQGLGLTEYEGFILVMTLPLSLMLVTAVVYYYFENNGNMALFLQRYRIKVIGLSDVLWGLGLFIFMVLSYGLFSTIGKMIIDLLNLQLPSNLFSLIDPRFVLNTENITAVVGAPITGNYAVLILYFILLVFNILGEELLWRGVILPRQEIAFGRYTWVLHGTLWTVFHLFKWWDLFGLLPVCLSLAYVAQRTKSIWPGTIAHFLFNGMGFVYFVLAVLG